MKILPWYCIKNLYAWPPYQEIKVATKHNYLHITIINYNVTSFLNVVAGDKSKNIKLDFSEKCKKVKIVELENNI